MTGARLRSLAAPTAFVLLAGMLALFGRIPAREAAMLSLAVLAAFVPGGLNRPGGWKRQSAEALLLPAAWILSIFGENTLRMMLLPPCLALASWAAWWAWNSQQSPKQHKGGSGLVATSGFGLSIALLGLIGKGTAPVPVLLHALSSALLAPAALFLGPVGVFGAALLGALSSTMIAGLLILPALLLLRFQRQLFESTRFSGLSRGFQSLIPICGGFGIFLLALSNWGLPPLTHVFPQSNWISILGLTVIVIASLRFPPAAAGALGLLACLLLGPPIPPIQEGGANIHLTPKRSETLLRAGNGGNYGLEISLSHGQRVREGATVGWLLLPQKRIPLRVGRELADSSLLSTSRMRSEEHSLPKEIVLRPPPLRTQPWKVSGRLRITVPKNFSPRLQRNPGIHREAVLNVLAAGPEIPAPPRDSDGEKWLWGAAAVLALIQLLSGLWKGSAGGIPWIPLIAGLMINRAAVEPLHLLGERAAIDLALTALLLAWIPAAWSWSQRRRFLLPAILLLGSLALATTHLTPPLWGDEPYHLALMESLVRDHVLKPATYLQGGGATRELILSTGHLFHSPFLAFLLLPGYFLGGRSGALLMLALYGAAAVVILLRVLRRSTAMQPRSEFFLFLILMLSYPLSCFTGQIWPAVGGILCTVGAMLLVTPDSKIPPRRAWSALALAAFSGALKTRMALISFPVAFSGLRDQRRSLRFWFGLFSAAAASLAVGWIFLGHPFGAFRRLTDLLPTDPILAGRVLLGLLFDSAGGLLWTAPFWIIAILFLPRLWREGDSTARSLIVGAGATLFLLLPSGEWYGGGSPPARYLVPLLPLVSIALAHVLGAPDGRRRLLILMAPPSFFAWWILTTRPHLGINPGDGRWYFSAILSRAFQADADALFPSFLHLRTASIFVPIVLSAGVLLLWWAFSRFPVLSRHLSRMSVAFWLIAAMAFIAVLLLRSDTRVEAEAPQVRRHGGCSFPSQGVPQRWAHTVGWSLHNGNSIDFPLHFQGADGVLLIGKLHGHRKGTRLISRWDQELSRTTILKHGIPPEGLSILGPGNPGRHRLSLGFEAQPGISLLVDRVEIRELN